ncbi:MAG: sigma-54-dependent transcriptional regulator [Pseudomonadales bacterium]
MSDVNSDRRFDRRIGKRALVVDDEPDIRELLEITLGRMGIVTTAAANVTEARTLLAEQDYDLCLTDLHLPDGNGVDLVGFIGEFRPSLPVAVITAYGSMDVAIGALKAGAFDFLQKPVDLEQLRALVDAALKLGDPGGAPRDGRTRLVGTSSVMERLRAQIAKLARSQAPIYLSGESGSGKEVAARLIHELGPRAEAPFVAVNCGAIPGELMESEFFGHVKGSFTGAVADNQGLFQAAAKGTLFLDEVADLPLSMQVKLLRAIQEKAVRAVGSAQENPIDVRVLCATHKDLGLEVAAGRFRQDLYYRLNVIELAMPSLRERRGDIPELAALILERLSADYGGRLPALAPDALQALQEYGFPGNVRELENILERAFTLCEGGTIRPHDLQLAGAVDAWEEAASVATATVAPATTAAATARPRAWEGADETVEATGNGTQATVRLSPGESLEGFLEGLERRLITEALEATRWNKTAAAKRLGITFRALRYRLKKLQLE